jgi:hypothetical protein
MPALLNRYPSYTGIYEHQPGYTYMPAWPMLFIFRPGPYLGQPAYSQPLCRYLSSLLTLPGVIPPTLVPKAAEVPQSQLWSLGRFNPSSFSIYSGFMLYADNQIIYRTSINTPATVPSPKLIRPVHEIIRTKLILPGQLCRHISEASSGSQV